MPKNERAVQVAIEGKGPGAQAEKEALALARLVGPGRGEPFLLAVQRYCGKEDGENDEPGDEAGRGKRARAHKGVFKRLPRSVSTGKARIKK